MNDLGAHAALKLRLRHFESFEGRLLVAGIERRLDLPDVSPHAREPRAVDRGATLGLTDALLRRLVVGHRLLAHGDRICRRRRVISAGAQRVKPAGPARPLADQRWRNWGLRFSAKAPMPSF